MEAQLPAVIVFPAIIIIAQAIIIILYNIYIYTVINIIIHIRTHSIVF